MSIQNNFATTRYYHEAIESGANANKACILVVTKYVTGSML